MNFIKILLSLPCKSSIKDQLKKYEEQFEVQLFLFARERTAVINARIRASFIGIHFSKLKDAMHNTNFIKVPSIYPYMTCFLHIG